MERLNERIAEAHQALATFEALARRRERSVIERDAAILRFAYTFEAVWKAAQLYLYAREGLEVGSPKQSIRASRRVGLLTDEQTEFALSMTDDRNLVVHVESRLVDTSVGLLIQAILLPDLARSQQSVVTIVLVLESHAR